MHLKRTSNHQDETALNRVSLGVSQSYTKVVIPERLPQQEQEQHQQQLFLPQQQPLYQAQQYENVQPQLQTQSIRFAYLM